MVYGYAKGCLLSDIMTTYFTSSKKVKSYIKENGIPDIIVIDKIFNNKEFATLYEEQYLTNINAAKSKKFLNSHNSNKNFLNTEESIEKARVTVRKNYENGYIHPQK